MDTRSSVEAFLSVLRQNSFYWTNRNQFCLRLQMYIQPFKAPEKWKLLDWNEYVYWHI